MCGDVARRGAGGGVYGRGDALGWGLRRGRGGRGVGGAVRLRSVYGIGHAAAAYGSIIRRGRVRDVYGRYRLAGNPFRERVDCANGFRRQGRVQKLKQVEIVELNWER